MKRPTLTPCCSNTTAYTRDSSLSEIGFERSWNKATWRRNLPGGLRDGCGFFPFCGRESAPSSTLTPDIPNLLALAEERVARSEAHLPRQRDVIATLRRLGHDTIRAHDLQL